MSSRGNENGKTKPPLALIKWRRTAHGWSEHGGVLAGQWATHLPGNGWKYFAKKENGVNLCYLAVMVGEENENKILCSRRKEVRPKCNLRSSRM